MKAPSNTKVSCFIGKVCCAEATIDALLSLEWQKPNPQLQTATPFGHGEWTQLRDAVSLSKELLRVGPITGVERSHATAYLQWTRDRFFQRQADIGAPNAALLNTSATERVVELASVPEAAQAEHHLVLAPNEALVFPINEIWFRTHGQGDFMILRGFFIGVTSETVETMAV